MEIIAKIYFWGKVVDNLYKIIWGKFTSSGNDAKMIDMLQQSRSQIFCSLRPFCQGESYQGETVKLI